MTATKSFRNQRLVTGSYVKYRIKRSWAVMLLCFIAMFFCTVVPFLISADYYAERYETQTAEKFIRSFTSYFKENAIYCVIISGGLAVAAGCASLSYLHNKVSAGFFHATPEKRSGHYIASLVSAIVDFALPFVANMLILTLAVAANGLLFRFVSVLLLKITLLCLFAYLIVLSVCYLAGMLTGTGAIHVIFTAYLLFILPVAVFSVAWWIGDNTSYLSFDALEYVFNRFILLSPVIRLGHVFMLTFSDAPYSIGIGSLVIDLILMPSTFVGAYLLYKKRPIESTGTPVIYRKLSETVKYSVMLPMAFLGAIIFYEMGDGDAWLIFGFFTGIILTFMLMNTVLHRTTKAMFSGLKGLGIFTVCAIAVFVTACTAVFGTVDYIVPQAKTITVHLDGSESITITDEKYVEAFRKEMKEFNKALKNDPDSVIYQEHLAYVEDSKFDVEITDSYNGYYTGDDIEAILKKNVRTSNFYVYYTDAFGAETRFHYHNVHLTAISDIKALLTEKSSGEVINNIDINSENFYANLSLYFYVNRQDLYRAINSDPILKEKLGYIESISEYSEHDYDYCLITAEYRVDQNYAQKYIEFIEAKSKKSTDVTPKQSIGNMHTYLGDYQKGYNETYPVYFDDLSVLESLIENESALKCEYINLAITNSQSQYTDNISVSEDSSLIPLILDCYSSDYVRKFADDVSSVFVYDRSANKITQITKKSEIVDIIGRCAQISSIARLSSFTRTDLNYVLYVSMEQDEDSYITYLLEK